MGAQQMNVGLNYLLGVEVSTSTYILLIAVISVIAMISVITGVDRGIRVLSELNMRLTMVILGLFVVFDSTAYMLTGGLAALQTATIVAALPFSFIMIMAIDGLFKSLFEGPLPWQVTLNC
jgi:choline-glycine betaine transporter